MRGRASPGKVSGGAAAAAPGQPEDTRPQKPLSKPEDRGGNDRQHAVEKMNIWERPREAPRKFRPFEKDLEGRCVQLSWCSWRLCCPVLTASRTPFAEQTLMEVCSPKAEGSMRAPREIRSNLPLVKLTWGGTENKLANEQIRSV